jgi:hypothetical protein
MSQLNSLLKSKNVLYIVAILAATNLFSYLMSGNWNAIVMFGIVGLITTYFTKNMIVVLASSLLITNALVSLNYFKGVREGMENEEKDEKVTHENNVNKKDNKDKSNYTKLNTSNSGKEAPSINYSETIEKAYENLEGLIGKDGIEKMTEQTANLAEKQKQLMKNIESMGPLIATTNDLLGNLNFNGKDKMQDTLSSMLGKVSGLQGSSIK